MKEKKILVIQTAFPGDAILTLPLIGELKKKYSGFLIDVVCIPSTALIFQNSPFINQVIIYDKHGKDKSLVSLFKFISLLRQNNYEMLYSPHRSFRTSLIVWLSRINQTTGFDYSSMSFVYKTKVHYEKNIHEVERNLKLMGFETENDNWKIKPEIKIDESINNKINILLNPPDASKYVAVAPASVWETKKYPKEYYLRLILHLISKGYFVFLIGSPAESELCNELKNHDPKNILSFAGKLNIIESIALLKRCSLLLCNDSAPTHMAMAAGIPALTIYCSTVPDFGFYPYNEKSLIVSYDDLYCKPCGIHGRKKCPVNTFDCGFKLLPEVIIEKIDSILA